MTHPAVVLSLACLLSTPCLAEDMNGMSNAANPRGHVLGEALPRGASRGIPHGGVTVVAARSASANQVGPSAGEECSLTTGRVDVLGDDERFGTLVRYAPARPSRDERVCAPGTVAFVDRWALASWPQPGLAEAREAEVAPGRAAAVERIMGKPADVTAQLPPSVMFGPDAQGR